MLSIAASLGAQSVHELGSHVPSPHMLEPRWWIRYVVFNRLVVHLFLVVLLQDAVPVTHLQVGQHPPPASLRLEVVQVIGLAR